MDGFTLSRIFINSWVYVEFFQGTPLLLQLFLAFFGFSVAIKRLRLVVLQVSIGVIINGSSMVKTGLHKMVSV